jgi:hypothetical protein
VSCRMLREWVCVVVRALAVITINGATFQPWLRILPSSSWYFVVFVIIVFKENLSLQ